MPSTIPGRRKRALEADRDEPAEHSLRRALAGRKISAGVLRSITKLVQATPEFASTPIEGITAISESLFETVRHVEVVPQTGGSEFRWEMCQPNLLLARTLQDSETLAKVYVDTLAEKPCSKEHPWHLILCFDEYTPGSLSHPQMSRKTMDVAFNFLELGDAVPRPRAASAYGTPYAGTRMVQTSSFSPTDWFSKELLRSAFGP